MTSRFLTWANNKVTTETECSPLGGKLVSSDLERSLSAEKGIWSGGQEGTGRGGRGRGRTPASSEQGR